MKKALIYLIIFITVISQLKAFAAADTEISYLDLNGNVIYSFTDVTDMKINVKINTPVTQKQGASVIFALYNAAGTVKLVYKKDITLCKRAAEQHLLERC